MKLIFCGTPEFAVPSLRAVLEAGHEVGLVVSQPDRPAGRGMVLQQPPVKRLARERGLPVAQPEQIRENAAFRAELGQMAPECIVVVAYGRLIPGWMLAMPRYGCVNVHGSLLPHYRGAAPVQWAVANGDRVTGVTTMQLEAGLDTGPMLLARDVPIPTAAMGVEMFDLLAEVGAELLVQTLQGLEAGSVRAVPQDHARATQAPILRRDDGRIDWSRPAQRTYDRWRGFYPWPGAWTAFREKTLLVHGLREARMDELAEPIDGQSAGEIVIRDQRLYVVCGGVSAVEVLELQMEGKKRMTAAEFLRGYRVMVGERLG